MSLDFSEHSTLWYSVLCCILATVVSTQLCLRNTGSLPGCAEILFYAETWKDFPGSKTGAFLDHCPFCA